MPRSESLGQFEQLVLAAIAGLEDNAYGVTIHTRVEQLSAGRKVTLAAIYVTLDRLEHKGLVSSRLTAPTAERGGRGKRCYHLEAPGERALKEAVATARRMADSLTAVWGVTEEGLESA
ncbi:MAG: PadR family transcriptional regulator [Bryobacteraceae bacterium]